MLFAEFHRCLSCLYAIKQTGRQHIRAETDLVACVGLCGVFKVRVRSTGTVAEREKTSITPHQ